ncbi:MAG: lysophospholipase L1-like esterase, partial [Pirellulaceae bacterium]
MNTFLTTTLATLVVLVSSIASADDRTAISADNPNIHQRGDFSDLKRKLTVDKKAHVGFIGGSITANAGGHTAMVPAWFRKNYPEVEFTFTNAGISSTCSTSGAFRLKNDLLSKGKLDLLIVEFAVNDDQDAGHNHENCVRGMEGIIRQLKQHNPAAAIVMVHYVNPGMLAMLQAGNTPISISAHHKTAEHYNVTEVNLAAEIANNAKAGKYSWQDYGGTHPNKFGYEIASNMITAALAGRLESKNTVADSSALPKPIDAYNYGNGRFIEISDAKLAGDWKQGKVTRDLLPIGGIRNSFSSYECLRGNIPGDTLTLEFTGRTVGAFILAGPDAGIVSSKIDGAEALSHDL